MNQIIIAVKNGIEANGWKIKYVAQKTGIDPDRMYRILSGKATMSATELVSICAMCQIDPLKCTQTDRPA